MEGTIMPHLNGKSLHDDDALQAQLRALYPELETVSLGAVIKHERERQQLSQRDIASRTGVAVDLVQQWEENASHPSTIQWKRLVGSIRRLRGLMVTTSGTLANLGEQVEMKKKEREEKKKAKAESVPPPAPKPKTRRFGIALGDELERENMTRIDLAKLLEVTVNAVANWEAERNVPTQATYDRIIALFPSLSNAKLVRPLRTFTSQPGFPARKAAEPIPPAPPTTPAPPPPPTPLPPAAVTVAAPSTYATIKLWTSTLRAVRSSPVLQPLLLLLDLAVSLGVTTQDLREALVNDE